MIHDGYWQDDLMVLSEEIGCLKKESNIELLNKTWGSSEVQEIQHKLVKQVCMFRDNKQPRRKPVRKVNIALK